ncbi:MAG TPA: efflux RND transporter periplasmic adaptor subunit [Opitutaceae bacterium]|nr:efflux RND transporter periplasmic adaptor subunit [Opitutaceae bacterium]
MLVVLAAAGVTAWVAFRTPAIVATVIRDKAVDAVPGSVVVHADGDIKELKTETGGRVESCEPLKEGGTFKKGEELLRLDMRELQRQIDEADRNHDAQLERLKVEKQNDVRIKVGQQKLDEVKRQFDFKHLSQTELEAAQREFERLQTTIALEDFDAKKREEDYQAAKKSFDLQKEKMVVKAPEDGTVKEVFAWPGALINGGTVVATMYSNARLVIAKISEEDFAKVKVGQAARVRLLIYPNDEFDAKVAKILPAADENTQRYTVYLEIPPAQLAPEKLRPFSTGEVTITVASRENQPLIPRRALLPDDAVLVVKNDRVEKRKIKIGFKSLNLVEALAGVAPGEQVIVEDVDQFRDGQHVRAEVAPQ